MPLVLYAAPETVSSEADKDLGGAHPYEGLRHLQDLYDTGVLTAEEFTAKKAGLLRRI